jgi:type I restriction enzyme R subunit
VQRLIDAENSDLFDVLAYVSYALQPITRDNRAANAHIFINTHFAIKQQAFLDFVLAHYVSYRVEEPDLSKLSALLNLRYRGSIADAINDLGEPQDIASDFADFQKSLYEVVA